ncbi:MAG TPA: MFS transporter [Jatrophihabitans sp.]|nr:MFS transporter [Jatrophihabitans sp.]
MNQTATRTATPVRDPFTTKPASDRRWLVMGFVAIAQLMVVLDATVVNIALPSAQRDLGFADGNRQWIVTAYALAFGSLLLLGGRLGDLFGRKRTFITGLIGFAAASVLGGAAGSFGMLVVARALQGVFGAILAPAALSTLVTTFTDPRERSRAFGIFGTVAVSGGAIGLILGGLLTEYASWRWCMYVNVVFAVVAVIGVALYMPKAINTQRPHLDLLGTLLASAGLFAVVFGFSRAESAGWAAASTLVSLITGPLLLIGFIAWQRRATHPLLPLRIPADRTRGAAYLSVGLAMVAMFGLSLFLTYYLQQVKGFSPIQSGLAFLPMVAGIITMSNASSLFLLPKYGPRGIIPLGMALGMIGMLGLARIEPSSSYAAIVLPSLILIGLAMGLIVAPAMNTATIGVAPADAGVASALVNTMQQVGGSIGTSVLSTLVATATASYLSGHPADPIAAASHGYSIAFLAAALVFAIGAVAALGLLPSRHALRAEIVPLPSEG